MAFEITVQEARAILQVTRAELRFLVERGDLEEFVVRGGKGQVVRRFLHYEQVVELAKKLERPVPIPGRTLQPQPRPPRDPSLLTATQVARAMHMSLRTFGQLVAEGRLAVAMELGKARFFRPEDVAELMRQVQEAHGLEPGGLELAPGDELLGAVQAGRLMETTPWKLYACVKKGLLPVARFTGAGLRLFRRSDVMALAETLRIRRRVGRKTA